MRKIAGCLNCGEPREIAAHGLCFTCYRREERAEDRQFARADRHNPGVRREHKKLLRGFTAVMTGLSDLGVPKAEVLAIRWMLEPYVTPIAEFLAPPPDLDEDPDAVNGEQRKDKAFTVCSGPELIRGRDCDEDGIL